MSCVATRTIRSLHSVALFLIATLLVGEAAATDHVVPGKQLTLRRNNVTNKGSLTLVLSGPAIPVPAVGSPDDPSLAGLSVTVFGRTTGTRGRLYTSTGLGQFGWRLRVTPRFVSYAYSYPQARVIGRDIRKVQMRTAADLRITAPTPGFSLDPAEGAVAVRVQYGAIRLCALFDGDAVRTSQPGLFVARNAEAPALADCSDESLAGAVCPCWTSESIDATFPDGYFDAAGRGGATCQIGGTVISLVSNDRCTYEFGPTSVETPRAGAAILVGDQCTMLPDLDPDDDGACIGPPDLVNLGAIERQVCIEEYGESQAYVRECF